MQQENARKLFPCFDEASYKVPMQVTIYAINEYLVLANMPEKETDKKYLSNVSFFLLLKSFFQLE